MMTRTAVRKAEKMRKCLMKDNGYFLTEGGGDEFIFLYVTAVYRAVYVGEVLTALMAAGLEKIATDKHVHIAQTQWVKGTPVVVIQIWNDPIK